MEELFNVQSVQKGEHSVAVRNHLCYDMGMSVLQANRTQGQPSAVGMIGPTARRLMSAYSDAALLAMDPTVSIEKAARISRESRSSFYRFWRDQPHLATEIVTDHLQGFLRELPAMTLDSLSRHETFPLRVQGVAEAAVRYLERTRAQHFVARHHISRPGTPNRFLVASTLSAVARSYRTLCPTRCALHGKDYLTDVMYTVQAVYLVATPSKLNPAALMRRINQLTRNHESIDAAERQHRKSASSRSRA